VSLRTLNGMRTYARDAAVAFVAATASVTMLLARAEVTGPVRAFDVVAATATAVPLLWRTRAPVVVFWACLALAVAGDLAGSRTPGGVVASLVALYAIARHCRARHLAAPLAAVAVILTGSPVDGAMRWSDVTAAAAIVTATVLLGLNARTRQAYLASLEERARRLEHERDQQAALAAAAERARIAREMHDVVAHNLAVMVALADGAAYAPDKAGEAVRQVSATGRQALDEMRRLVGVLRAGDGGGGDGDGGGGGGGGERRPQPGFADIDGLVDQVRAAGVRVAVTTDGTPGAWGPGAGLAVYRIVQEALTNTLKHAGPGAGADLWLRYTDEGAEVEVVDDGAGRATGPVDGGRHGLAGMAERAAPYGGTVDAGPRPGRSGWRVHTRLRFS
jgi:signal transduction histidine kinase